MKTKAHQLEFWPSVPNTKWEDQMADAKEQLKEINGLIYDLAKQKTDWLTGEGRMWEDEPSVPLAWRKGDRI
jgi:hypothetical protein